MKSVIKLLITAVAAYALSSVLKGVEVSSFMSAVAFALVLGGLNAVLKPVLSFLSFPITVVTFGLFLLVINAAIILMADYFIGGIEIHGFWQAVIFSIALSLVTSVLEAVFISGKGK